MPVLADAKKGVPDAEVPAKKDVPLVVLGAVPELALEDLND